MKTRLLLLALLLSINCFSQFSKTHYIPPVSSETIIAGSQYIYISTSNTNPVNFRINQLGSTMINGTVSRDNPQIIDIGSGNGTQVHVPEFQVNQILNNKGYIIEAEDLIAVSIRIRSADTNHASSIVSKGLAALGYEFRIGAFLNTLAPSYGPAHYTFVSILATENNTLVHFDDIKTGVSLINNMGAGNTPSDIILNSGESFVMAVEGNSNPIPDGLIGALVKSDKPIAVNCGSFGGSNGESTNLDMGFDQIVSTQRIGSDYIFIKSSGWDNVERVLLVAHEDNTDIFLNGETLPLTPPTATLMAGEYIALDGSYFSANGNLYVRSSKNIFAYQGVGNEQNFNTNGSANQANQQMFFVPPLSCQTPHNINNIPQIEKIGTTTFTGRITIVTRTGSNLNFIVNGTNYLLNNLPAGTSVSGPRTVTGNSAYETYTITGLTGNVSIFSTSEVYVAAYGNNAAATFGGFYSGFTFKPEIVFTRLNTTSENCIPNIELSVSSSTSFDTFKWYFNNVEIPGATSNIYKPLAVGYYKVMASISNCAFPTLASDEIPVSSCPTNMDGDLANDNIDIDNDNDGITNCTESFGNQIINTSVSAGTIPQTTTNYATAVTNSILVSPTPFTGNSNGSFITDLPPGKNAFVTYTMTFNKPVNITLDYPTTANATDLLNANAEYVVSSDINKTITVLNPTDELLIDTNYDGIYESGITQFSSFEIRFRLNGNTPLAAGATTFKFQTYQTNSIKITHKNLLDSAPNRSTFKIFATCVPNDTDGDNIPNQIDTDSDGDSILDITEAQVDNALALSNTDTNLNGLDNAFEPGLIPMDKDLDSVPDYLDLDSDNDGILDATEKGLDLDLDGVKNYRDLDQDGDSCNDVIEAGFLDPNNDGLLGNVIPPTVNASGLVTSGVGYTAPNSNYSTKAIIAITTQPEDKAECLLQTATFTLASNATAFQWQLSTDGGVNWTDLTDNAIYSGSLTNTLTVSNLAVSMNNHVFRVKLNITGNSCDYYSTNATLVVYPLPVLNSTVRIVQCDDNTDGITVFNLRQKENELSVNFATDTFDYFTTQTGAETNDPFTKIQNPLSYPNATPFSQTVWVRVTNTNGCFSVTSMLLISSTSNAILNNANIQPLTACDDYLDAINDDYDRISSFDFSSVVTYINGLLPAPNYTYKFYKNRADFLQENDVNGNSLAIPDSEVTNYRNIGYPETQTIWVRLEDSNTNDCVGSTSFTLIVEPKPNIDINDDHEDDVHICTNDSSIYQYLHSGLPNGANTSDYTFEWKKDNVLLSETGPILQTNEAGIYVVKVSYATGLNCFRERTITVSESNSAILSGTPIVNDLSSENNTISINVTGLGNYVFTIDDIYGTQQNIGFFENVTPGLHTIYVIDLNGCPVLEIPVSVIGFPKYFTPNGDGYNDTWNIIGTSNFFNANAKILIFNRFGKLLKEITPLGNGWDGNYLGQPQIADDYWYSSQLEDGRSVRGHFTLKR